jgi:hypothetical protein
VFVFYRQTDRYVDGCREILGCKDRLPDMVSVVGGLWFVQTDYQT